MEKEMTTREILEDGKPERIWQRLKWRIFLLLEKSFYVEHRWVCENGIMFYAGIGRLAAEVTAISKISAACTLELFEAGNRQRVARRLKWNIFRRLGKKFFVEHRQLGRDGIMFYLGAGSLSATGASASLSSCTVIVNEPESPGVSAPRMPADIADSDTEVIIEVSVAP
jgi:hypothetical protein